MHLTQHSTAPVIEQDTGAQSSREESSVFISDVNHPQFCMLKGQQELRTTNRTIIWLAVWFHGYFDRQLHNNITWDPSQNHYHCTHPDRIQTLDHICFPTLLQGATSELTQMDINQHVHIDSDRHKSGSVVAPEVHFCHTAPAHCSAAATALPGPIQYDQSARRAADLHQCPFSLCYSLLQWQYCYYNGDAMLCTYQCEQFFCFSFLHWKEVSKWDLETLAFWPLSRTGFTKDQAAETAFPSVTVFLCNAVLTPPLAEWST